MNVTSPLIEEGFWSSLVSPITSKEREHDSFLQTRPNPLTLVDKEWASSEEAFCVLRYIESPSIMIESFELGLAPCRFLASLQSRSLSTGSNKVNLNESDTLGLSLSSCNTAPLNNHDDDSSFSFCLSNEMGCSSLTDGVFVFPEGLAHYIRRHGVRPSKAFVSHIRERLQMIEGEPPSKSIVESSRRLLFDPESRKGVNLPTETRQYLFFHSSLTGL